MKYLLTSYTPGWEVHQDLTQSHTSRTPTLDEQENPTGQGED